MSRLSLVFACCSLPLLACADKSSDEDDDGGGSTIGVGQAWWVPPGGARYTRASDGAEAWRVSAGACMAGAGGLQCDHELEITGPVGRNCPGCDDQLLTVSTVWASDGAAHIDGAELHEGDGMPLGVALSGLGLALLPSGPWAVGGSLGVGAEVALPDELVPVFARFILLSEGGAFTSRHDTTHSDCTVFAYADSAEAEVLAIVAACEGEGIVQVAFPGSELSELDAIAPFAGVREDRLFLRD